MAPDRKALLQVHFCVLLWGFTAILGKLITLPALALVWWRMLLVVAAAMLFPAFWRGLAGMGLRTVAVFAGIGAIVSLHWLTFYGSIKLSNASVAATCMAVTPVFTSLVEPWLTRSRFDSRDMLIGIVAIPGVALVAGGTPEGMRAGILVGVVSAILVALFGSLNKRYVHAGHPLTVTGIELAAGTVLLTVIGGLAPGVATLPPLPGLHDAVLLAVLAFACTLFPFWLSLIALKHLSAFSTQLAISLEPVYAIVLAILLLGEQRELGAAFYAGVAIILASVFAHTALKLRRAP